MDKNLLEILEYIDPSNLDYQEWVDVGMALKYEGYTAYDWEQWSSKDIDRYREGECYRKWNTFHGSASPVTAGTIVKLAKDNGWLPTSKEAMVLDWDDEISRDYKIVDDNWVESVEIEEPKFWNPVQELVTYLETLFDSTDLVGYVTQTYPIQDKKTGEVVYKPTQGSYDRTAGQLIQELQKCNGDIGAVFGDYKEASGAWIRFNPLDGKGVKNDNVTDFRYALVESDSMELGKQYALFKELELPIAALVHSGKKSIHAIVKVEARDYQEYRKRVDYIYAICKKNGVDIDTQNRNPSRLSRMPGVIRNGKKQFLIDTNIGKATYEEWYQHIEDLNDELPDPEGLESYWDNLPQLAPELIKGVLRQGHKMLIAGPSKAGKSFALIGLSIAIAEGRKWLGWDCTKGRVLYVNLELDKASCLHRFKDVCQSLGISPEGISNIDIWNLRGKTVPMDKLAPKLIRRAVKKNYIAVIIDPIYKVLTGDENSADQMAHFTNQFDKVATELGCSVIYCHHHSKGSQGGKKSMDRASGSGVFARDPDALIDLVELDITDEIYSHLVNKASANIYAHYIHQNNRGYYDDHVGLDDLESKPQMSEHASRALGKAQIAECEALIAQAVEKVKMRTAWRVEGTLREFAKFKPVNLWFDYPKHDVDDSGILSDIKLDEDKHPWQKAKDGRDKYNKDQKSAKLNEFEIAFSGLEMDGEVTVKSLADELDVDSKLLGLWFGNGNRAKKEYKKRYELFYNQEGLRCVKRKS